MKQLVFMWIIAVCLSGCIEHRPEDTTFVAEKKDSSHVRPVNMKGLRVYTGTIPCADCPGIEQRLALKGDSSGIYRLTETYKQATDDGDAVLISTGEWKRFQAKTNRGSIPVYYLSQGNIKDSSRIIRYQVYNNKIVQMDMEGIEITTPELYTLKLVQK